MVAFFSRGQQLTQWALARQRNVQARIPMILWQENLISPFSNHLDNAFWSSCWSSAIYLSFSLWSELLLTDCVCFMMAVFQDSPCTLQKKITCKRKLLVAVAIMESCVDWNYIKITLIWHHSYHHSKAATTNLWFPSWPHCHCHTESSLYFAAGKQTLLSDKVRLTS